MQPLRLKTEVELLPGETYSICLRGARRYDTSDEFDLSIYTPESGENPKVIANILSQNHYRFMDIIAADYIDNYNPSARNRSGLEDAMMSAYDRFQPREIVTILRFLVV